MDEEHGNCFPRSPQSTPSPTPPRFSGGAQLLEDGAHGRTSETYFYQSEVRSSNLLGFLFSHVAFYFPFKCAYCTLDSGYVFFLPPLAFWDPTSDTRGPRPRVIGFTRMRSFKKNKNGSFCISTRFGCFFSLSNHTITVYTCIVWLYWNYVDIARGVI